MKRARENRDFARQELQEEQRRVQKLLILKDQEIAELTTRLAQVERQAEDLKKKR